jgi:hypothetical protein
MSLRLRAAAVALIVAIAPATVQAQTSAITTIPSSVGLITNGQFSVGYYFDVVNPFLVTALSYWDAGGDGLAESHTVGIFDALGNLLGSATVNAGTGNPLLDGFRLATLSTPFTLAVGQGYWVLGTDSGNQLDPIQFFSTVINGPGIDYQLGAYCYGSTLVDPETGTCGLSGSNIGNYIGGSFAGTPVTSTPEPSSVALLGTGLIGVAGVVRRRGWRASM